METDEVSPTEDGLTYAHRRLFARQIESMSLPTNIDLPTSPWVARVGVVTLRMAWVAMLNLTPTQHTASVSASVKHKEHACAKRSGAAVRVLWVFPVWKTGGHAE